MQALLTVSKKEPDPDKGETFMGIREFARELALLGFDRLIGSIGTARHIAEAGIDIRNIAEVSGQEPVMNHLVVTLGAGKSASILAEDSAEHRADLATLGWEWTDLVCCDLYDGTALFADSEISDRMKNRNGVDIGGRNMIEEGAKGSVDGRVVICDPYDRSKVIDWYKAGKPDEKQFLTYLAAKAEACSAAHSLTAANWRSGGQFQGIVLEQVGEPLKYGENPQQGPARHMTTKAERDRHPLSPSRFRQRAGARPSFNNLNDLSTAFEILTRLTVAFEINGIGRKFIAVAIKHQNPCGIGVGDTVEEAVAKMIDGDAISLKGGVVGINGPVSAEITMMLRTRGMPVAESDEKQELRGIDCIAAASFADEAVERFKRKKGRCRVLENDELGRLDRTHLNLSPRYQQLFGDDWVVQPANPWMYDLSDERHQRFGPPCNNNIDQLIACVSSMCGKSNSIAIANNGMQVAFGGARMSRLEACELAVNFTALRRRARRAVQDALSRGLLLMGAKAASDSFFVDSVGPAILVEAGIDHIYATSGSDDDAIVIPKIVETGVGLTLIPDVVGRAFKH